MIVTNILCKMISKMDSEYPIHTCDDFKKILQLHKKLDPSASKKLKSGYIKKETTRMTKEYSLTAVISEKGGPHDNSYLASVTSVIPIELVEI